MATGRQTDSLAGMVNVKRFGALTHTFWSEFQIRLVLYLSIYRNNCNFFLIIFIRQLFPPCTIAPSSLKLRLPRRSHFFSYIINNSYLSINQVLYSNCNIGFLVRYNVFFSFFFQLRFLKLGFSLPLFSQHLTQLSLTLSLAIAFLRSRV